MITDLGQTSYLFIFNENLYHNLKYFHYGNFLKSKTLANIPSNSRDTYSYRNSGQLYIIIGNWGSFYFPCGIEIYTHYTILNFLLLDIFGRLPSQ